MQVRISGWNGRFGGTCEVYLPLDALANAAEELKDFPSNGDDNRELRFGDSVMMRFFSEGLIGRSFLEFSVESVHSAYQCAERVSPQTVRFHAAVEANAVDVFVSELRSVQTNCSDVAKLNLLEQK